MSFRLTALGLVLAAVAWLGISAPAPGQSAGPQPIVKACAEGRTADAVSVDAVYGKPQMGESAASASPGTVQASSREVDLEFQAISFGPALFEELCNAQSGKLAAASEMLFLAADDKPNALNERQVRALFETVQTDRATTIMRWPGRRVADGSRATLAEAVTTQWFVTSVETLRTGDKLVFNPKNEPVPIGIQLAAQPKVYADGNAVQLTLEIDERVLFPGKVPLIPVVVKCPSNGPGRQQVPFTQFIQKPHVFTYRKSVTAAVPDGGWAVMATWATPCQVRPVSERSLGEQIPYLSRLYKNVGSTTEAEWCTLLARPKVVRGANSEVAKAPPPPSFAVTSPAPGAAGPQVRELVVQYRKACAEGRKADAARFAGQALALDPACFGGNVGN